MRFSRILQNHQRNVCCVCVSASSLKGNTQFSPTYCHRLCVRIVYAYINSLMFECVSTNIIQEHSYPTFLCYLTWPKPGRYAHIRCHNLGTFSPFPQRTNEIPFGLLHFIQILYPDELPNSIKNCECFNAICATDTDTFIFIRTFISGHYIIHPRAWNGCFVYSSRMQTMENK